MPAIDRENWLPGRVLRQYGLDSVVETDDGKQLRCKVRRLLKSLTTDSRNIVATGDRGGDAVSLAAYLYELSQGEAARKLARTLGLDR